MTVKPVETAPQPKYPDKYSSEALKIVRASQPRRWTGAPLVTGVLAAAVALGLSGCGRGLAPGAPDIAPPPVETGVDATAAPEVTPTSFEYIAPGEPSPIPNPTPAPTPTEEIIDAFVTMGIAPPISDPDGYVSETPAPFRFGYIPLFEFGDGTGSIGCVSVTGPVFLSEDEAFAILSAVFEQAGLTLDKECDSLESINRPVTDYNWHNDTMPTVSDSLLCDGSLEIMDGLPMVFVSWEDFEDWKGEVSRHNTVYSINIKAAARTLADNNPNLLVFYDPMAETEDEILDNLEREEDESDEAFGARWDAIRVKLIQEAQTKNEQLLRQQAEAFLQWLRDEGIIGSK